MTQKQLAALAEMAQPRISAMERPGATKFNIETLVRLASAFKVGLKVQFVPFSEMLAWENDFSQDQFNPPEIGNDLPFLNPAVAVEAQAAVQPRPEDLAALETNPVIVDINQGMPPSVNQSIKLESTDDTTLPSGSMPPEMTTLPGMAGATGQQPAFT